MAIVSAIYLRAAEATAASLAAAIGVIATVKSMVGRAARQVKGLLGKALDEVDHIEARARAKQTAEEQRVERERSELATRLSELEREQIGLGKRRGELEVELAALQRGDRKTLKDFIVQRASSGDYRKNLGVISAIHRDFKQLSEFLDPNQPPPNVERIILYIDDLDRCPPARVVEVLQAIHVILSLPLFVVVVGVDSRWLLDSLTTYYRRQFPGNDVTIDAARPQSYLEKIFQIPLTLLPMSSDGYGRLVGSLLEPYLDGAPASSGRAPRTTLTYAGGNGAPSSPTTPSPAVTTELAAARETLARIDLTPRGLRLEPRETEYARTLSGLIASPRGAKRMVNLYRIVRATLDDKALDRLVEGQYKLTQILLALVVGHPVLAAELFQSILSWKLASQADLIAWCVADPPGRSARDRVTLQQLQNVQAEFADWTAAREVVCRVARFSFETGRVLAQYIDAAEPKRSESPDPRR